MYYYDHNLTLRQARQLFFERAGFDEDGYNDSWVRLKAGFLVISFPNTTARRRAVVFHDLHHILTGYETTWVGESEIGAWEIASGCGRHYPAWLLNATAMGIGLVIAPRLVYSAFVRGRRSRNLYRSVFNDALLDRTVGAVTDDLGLSGSSSRAGAMDVAAFACWLAVTLAWLASPLIIAAFVVALVAGWVHL